MGYYTSHTITITDADGNDVTDNLIEDLAKHTGYAVLQYESIKWYNEESDMREFSALHPGLVFRVDGEGEEPGDIWTHWYKDGKQQSWVLDVVRPANPPEPWA